MKRVTSKLDIQNVERIIIKLMSVLRVKHLKEIEKTCG